VATTVWPASNAERANEAPRPLEVPVMSHTSESTAST
ncbi:MAG: hypothetical protein JWL70_1022, partial [Acidimicrobiia bacterium]|nr:hypothetical protein [Acidimicrobiia bacterium]